MFWDVTPCRLVRWGQWILRNGGNYLPVRGSIPGDRNVQLYRCENLKSCRTPTLPNSVTWAPALNAAVTLSWQTAVALTDIKIPSKFPYQSYPCATTCMTCFQSLLLSYCYYPSIFSFRDSTEVAHVFLVCPIVGTFAGRLLSWLLLSFMV